MKSNLEKEEIFSKRAGAKKQALPKTKQNVGDFFLENVTKIQKDKSPQIVKFLITALKSHFVFYNISQIQLEQIIQKMFYCEVQQNNYIFKQGEDATSFFILESGSLKVIVNKQEKRELKIGEGFGELALLYNAPRSASILASKNSSLWGIDRQTFRKAVEDLNLKELAENKKFLQNVKFCQNLTDEQKNSVSNVLVALQYQRHQKIVIEGDPGNSFYIIKKGSVGVYKGSKLVRVLQVGDSFGEQALYFSQQRTMTCMAEEDQTICISLGRDTLTSILGDQVSVIAYRNMMKWAIEKSKHMKISQIALEKILDNMSVKNIRKGEVIIKAGTPIKDLIICIEAGLKMKNDLIAQKGTVFGDQLLSSNDKKDVKFKDDISSENDGMFSNISIELYKIIVNQSGSSSTQTTHEQKMKNSVQKYKPEKYKIENLLFIKELGSGQFGLVYLVQDKADQSLFALKCIQKKQVIVEKLEKHLQQEKQVMEAANFPLIMQFVKSYKDMAQIYFLLEYIDGMELFDVIREIGLLSSYDTQYYIGSMILILEYLHMQNIIYRDLKPENIMVDRKGIMYLIDMGTAKVLPSKSSRTVTIIGTPHYMAPEVITGKGYNYFVDLWSVGICFYEFMCGAVPYGEEVEDPFEIYEEIIKSPIKYPSFFKDRKAKKLIDMLLHKIPEIRLPGSYAALKGNPFFDAINWDNLLDCKQKPPFFPPEDKMINKSDIAKMTKRNIPIMQVINKQLKEQGLYEKQFKSKEQGWDDYF